MAPPVVLWRQLGGGLCGARSYQLEVETKFPPWRRPVCGGLRLGALGGNWRLLHSSLLPRPERRCWRPFRLGPWDSGTLSPAGSPRAWMSLDLARPSSLPLNPCLEAGLGARERRTELGWPEELALVSSWATSPGPHPDSQVLKDWLFREWGCREWGRVWLPCTLPRQRKSWFSDLLGERLCCPDYELYNRVYSFCTFLQEGDFL